MPFQITPLLYLAAILAIGGSVWLALDTYGNYRADQVHQLYERAAEKTNEDLAQFSSEDTARAVRVLTELKGASDKAAGVASSLSYSADQADAINRIRSAGQ